MRPSHRDREETGCEMVSFLERGEMLCYRGVLVREWGAHFSERMVRTWMTL